MDFGECVDGWTDGQGMGDVRKTELLGRKNAKHIAGTGQTH